MAELTDPVLRRMRAVHFTIAGVFLALWLTGMNGCQLVVDELGHAPVSPPYLPLDLYRVASAVTIAILLLAYSWHISRAAFDENHTTRKRTLRLIFLGSIIYLLLMVEGPLMVVNRLFDESPPIARTARITKKEVSHGSRGSTVYYAMLAPWRTDMNVVRLYMSEDTYHDPRFAVGQSIEFTTRAGFLGGEYILWKSPS
jgi:hypothetical protein